MEDTIVSPVTVCQIERENLLGPLSLQEANDTRDDWYVKFPTCLSPTVKAMFPAVKEGISTCWSANGTSSLLILSLHRKKRKKKLFSILTSRKVGPEPVRPRDGLRAVAVDVVHGRLRLQGARVDPEEDQRATLLVVKNLEGQGAQVVLVPAAAERRRTNGKINAHKLLLKFHIVRCNVNTLKMNSFWVVHRLAQSP